MPVLSPAPLLLNIEVLWEVYGAPWGLHTEEENLPVEDAYGQHISKLLSPAGW